MSEKKMVRRSIAVTLGIVCIVLMVVILVGAVLYVVPTLKASFKLVDPSYQEMLTFIANESVFGKGKTEDSIFDSTSDFVNDAFNVGYRCGTVLIGCQDGTYSVAVFNTTDRGLFFVDASANTVIKLVIGQCYSETNKLAKPNYDDTVLSYTIIW